MKKSIKNKDNLTSSNNASGTNGGHPSHDFAIVEGNLPKHQHGIGHGHTGNSSSAGSHSHKATASFPFREWNSSGGSPDSYIIINGNANNSGSGGQTDPRPIITVTVNSDSGAHTHPIAVDAVPSSIKSDDGSSAFLSESITIPTEPPFLRIKYIIKF